MSNIQPSFHVTDTVGSIVTQQPALSRIFEKLGIDYCCGGKLPLSEACQKKGLDVQSILKQLEQATQTTSGECVDAGKMTLTELTHHIETTHHKYLKNELPRLHAMTKKVAAVHGDRDIRLQQIHEIFSSLATEMDQHMLKEEQILFPLVRQLEASETAPEFHCGSVMNPIHVMEMEHDSAGSALAKMRDLSNGFMPPEGACNTHRAMLDGLSFLEQDLHQHVHKENNILFPRTITLEKQKSQA